ncbi:unnamed protein product [Cylindrotheca closterium]|uniref:B30.2/SPRY domain-containing protein n=1 Tax=Cylindrotheca closterium TaxID=2856 RepID=A0AAD2FCU7_9STRA|nr:unnamed protein product [Cylindrotheca closterium]
MIRRVSSRQRLVSWDAFDATAANPAEFTSSSDEEEGWNQQHASSAPQTTTMMISRKRERSKQNAPSSPLPSAAASAVAVAPSSNNTTVRNANATTKTSMNVPAFAWEFAAFQPQPMDQVPEDVYLYMCSFLDLPSIRNVMALNHKFRQLLLSADSFWMTKCQSLWEGLMPSNALLVDSTMIPTVLKGPNCNMTVNLPLLISMTPANLPTKVDETLLGTCRRVHRTVRLNHHSRSLQIIERTLTPNQDELVVITCQNKKSIQYTGRVGSGDRCIRSNHPLPRPTRSTNDGTSKSSTTSMSQKRGFLLKKATTGKPSSLFDLLCRGSSSAIYGRSLSHIERPFCAPYVDGHNNNSNNNLTLRVGPRMVAYFEVSILESSSNTQRSPRDCVAVGVATESFSCQTRMPGWDAQSFGYHGDDGGTFHASGAMLERFGPCFGTGDTVGCGIDYVARGIFFTLNGVFLGYGWKQIDSEFLENNLFGVVGIDTNDPVSVNYGNVPFQFNLTRFTSKHDQLITHQYQHHTTIKKETVEDDTSELADLPSYPEI